MSTAEKIRELTYIISHSKDEKLINMVYALVREYQASLDDVELSDAQKDELNSRIEARKSGQSQSHSWDDVQKKLNTV